MARYFLEFLFPILLKMILEWLDNEKSEMSTGYLLAGLLSGAIVLRGYLGIRGDYITERMSARARNVIRVTPRV